MKPKKNEPKNELAPLPEQTPSPEQADVDYKQMVDEIVGDRIAEMLADKAGADLEPFFRPREISERMRKHLPIAEANKWKWFFEDYGCLVCTRKDVRHRSLGFCESCLNKTRLRLKAAIRNRAPKPEPTFHDSAQLAREAILPSLKKLSQKRLEDE
jgi:hypothetical protein